MDLRTYQAYSMAQALAAVKRDLGPEAVILNTRSYKRGGLLGIGSRTIFELTATADGRSAAPRSSSPASESAPRARAGVAAARAYSSAAAASSGAPPDGDAAPTEFDRLKTRRLAQAMQIQHERRKASAAAPSTVDVPAPPFAAPPMPAISVAATLPAHRGASGAPPATPALPVARRFRLTPVGDAAAGLEDAVAAAEATFAATGPAARTERRSLVTAPTGTARHAADPVREPAPAPISMRDELAAIRQMVGTVLQRRNTIAPGAGPDAMPQKLFEMYLKLVGQEMSDELADRIIASVRVELSDEELDDEQAVRDAVRRHVATYVPVADEAVPERSPDGRPLTLALVGPTGVGKTTTLAKLAASFKLRHGRKVGLVTADTYRIAAVDQLRTYAEIIGLPLRVALTPDEMRRSVESLSDCDVVLIDTAGRSQNDTGRLEELRAFIDAAAPHEVHLVLSSTAGERVLLREAEAFCAIGVDKVVLTKLDEAVSFGMLIDVTRRIGKDLSFITNGQEVPDHIEVVRADRLAGMVMGAVAGA